jgi:hypothetical protein
VAPSRAAGVASRVIRTKAGTTSTNNSDHGIIITGLRPYRSDSQPLTGARQTSHRPMITVAPKATSSCMCSCVVANVFR